MPSRINYKESEYKLEKAKIEIGWLGKIFGDGDKSAKNIVGLVAVIMSISIILTLFFIEDRTKEIVASLVSVLTLCIGYLVGAKNS